MTLDDRNTAGKLTISADNDYALYTYTVNKGDASKMIRGDKTTTLENVNYNDVIEVTVYAEDGVAQETWTINVSEYVKVDGAITTVKSSGGNITLAGAENPMPMYSDFDTAVSKAVQLTRSDVEMIAIHANDNVVVADIDATNTSGISTMPSLTDSPTALT